MKWQVFAEIARVVVARVMPYVLAALAGALADHGLFDDAVAHTVLGVVGQ